MNDVIGNDRNGNVYHKRKQRNVKQSDIDFVEFKRNEFDEQNVAGNPQRVEVDNSQSCFVSRQF